MYVRLKAHLYCARIKSRKQLLPLPANLPPQNLPPVHMRASQDAAAQANARHCSCNCSIYYSGYHSNEADIPVRGLRLSPKCEDISQAHSPGRKQEPAVLPLSLAATRGQQGASLRPRTRAGAAGVQPLYYSLP